ncbi:hypothetical protein [Catellatospora tritici]|uniref:hypothetical protein n=1 Tax=Catellatospora tritici TaxID=2851566 RepID=UPI001C2D342C|nr:hypothetical protein [Catellatospora tritici]MBV1849069.1 hypothetical protein [Catellatospora tritici]
MQFIAALRQATWLDWLLIGFLATVTAVFVMFWSWSVPAAWDGLRANFVGSSGTVMVASCEDLGIGKDLRHGWSCRGRFVADDGAFEIESVRAVVKRQARPGGELAVRASGPEAETVWPAGEVEWIAAVVLAVGLPFAVLLFLRWLVDGIRPVTGWPDKRSGTRQR